MREQKARDSYFVEIMEKVGILDKITCFLDNLHRVTDEHALIECLLGCQGGLISKQNIQKISALQCTDPLRPGKSSKGLKKRAR